MKQKVSKAILYTVLVFSFSFLQVILIGFFASRVHSLTSVYFLSFITTSLLMGIAYLIVKRAANVIIRFSLGYQHHNYKKSMDDTLHSITTSDSTANFASSILRSINQQVSVRHAAVLIKAGDRFVLKASDGLPPELHGLVLREDNLMVAWLSKHRQPLRKAELLEDFDSHLLTKEDIKHLHELHKTVEDLQVQVAFPIVIKNELIGIFAVGKPVGKLRYTGNDMEFLHKMGYQIIVGSQHISLAREVDNKVREMNVLQKMGKIVNSHIDIDIMLHMLTRVIVEGMALSRGALFLYNDDKRTLEVKALYGFDAAWKTVTFKVRYQQLLRFCKDHRLVHFRKEYKRILHLVSENDVAIEDGAFVPIRRKDILLGFLLVDGFPLKMNLTPAEESTLAVFSGQIYTALDKAAVIAEKREQLQQLYRLNEEIYNMKLYTENILENLDHAVIAVNNDNIITVFNKAAQQSFGLSPHDVLGQDIATLASLRPALRVLMGKSSSDGKSFDHVIEYGNSPVPVRGHSIQLHEGDTVFGKLIVFSDISQVKDLEKQLFFNDRLTSLGTIAASVIHEIKNPLASLKMFSQVMKTKYAEPDFWDRYGSIVVDEIERLDVLVTNFLGFTKKENTGLFHVEFMRVIDKVSRLVNSRMKREGIRMSVHIPEQFILLAEEQSLQQVMLNIILNSEQSFTRDRKDKIIDIRAEAADAVARITITDNGIGIPRQTLDKIFDPFYTTKRDGTGLGLSISSRIISSMNGTLACESEEGHGTTFIITLPMVRQQLLEFV